MSMPFIEMPQRAEALPSMTSRPPRPVAPAACEASPFTRTLPDIMFSATPCAGIALDDDGRALVHAGAVVADMAFDLDREPALEPDGDGVLAARIENAPMRLVGVGSESGAARH